MYIDSRVWRPGGGGDGDPEEPRPRRDLDIPWRGIGWTLVVVWLFVASVVTTSDVAAAALSWTGVLIAFWRCAHWLGRNLDGMHDHKQ